MGRSTVPEKKLTNLPRGNAELIDGQTDNSNFIVPPVRGSNLKTLFLPSTILYTYEHELP